jgi:hypothetical protein
MCTVWSFVTFSLLSGLVSAGAGGAVEVVVKNGIFFYLSLSVLSPFQLQTIHTYE